MKTFTAGDSFTEVDPHFVSNVYPDPAQPDAVAAVLEITQLYPGDSTRAQVRRGHRTGLPTRGQRRKVVQRPIRQPGSRTRPVAGAARCPIASREPPARARWQWPGKNGQLIVQDSSRDVRSLRAKAGASRVRHRRT